MYSDDTKHKRSAPDNWGTCKQIEAEDAKKLEGEYIVLELLIGNPEFRFAESFERKAAKYKMMSFDQQKEMLEKLSPFAPKPISASHAARKFERLIGKTFSDLQLR